MHVCAALVAELLLARGPEPEPGVLAGREPRAVVLAREHLEPEALAVEGLERVRVAGLQGQLGEALCERFHRAAGIPTRGGG